MKYRDYEEFIAELNGHNARYLIVGAHAVAYHARPRATKDFDVLIDPSRKNAGNVLAALNAFLGSDLGYAIDDLCDPESIIQLGIAPVRIDVLSGIKGCPDFDLLWLHRIDAPFGTVSAHYLGLDDLIAAKTASARPQDRADVRILKRARSRNRETQDHRKP